MKLRLRENTLRLRVNRREVEILAAGEALREEVFFPGNARLRYLLETREKTPAASFEQNTIRINAPIMDVRAWARGDSIGLYFDLPASSGGLKVSIEKDLECIDGPPAEYDPEAFAREPHMKC